MSFYYERNSLEGSEIDLTALIAEFPEGDEMPGQMIPVRKLSEAFDKCVKVDDTCVKEESAMSVYLRIRPMSSRMLSESTITIETDQTIVTNAPESSRRAQYTKQEERKYAFSRVFGPQSSQSDVYSHALTPLLERFFEGSDCLLFAYGTANSGKTYTIQGTHSNPGLLPTLVEEILEVADRMSDVGDCELKVTMLEIYQEKIHDLLSEKKEKLSLRDVNGRLEVSRLSSHVLSSMGGAIALMERAASKRACSTERTTAGSSRSHALYTLTLCRMETSVTFQIVDLAGYEKCNRLKTNATQQKESNNINVSLMQLWKCLQGVKKKHSEISIPFRESKLTHLLLPGLFRNGLSGVAMIACVNPHADDYDENISILGNASLVDANKDSKGNKLKKLFNNAASILTAAALGKRRRAEHDVTVSAPQTVEKKHTNLTSKRAQIPNANSNSNLNITAAASGPTNGIAYPSASDKKSSNLPPTPNPLRSPIADRELSPSMNSIPTKYLIDSSKLLDHAERDDMSETNSVVKKMRVEISRLQEENIELLTEQFTRETEIRVEVSIEMAERSAHLLDQLQDLQLQLDQKILEQKGEINPRSTKKICKDLRNVQIEKANKDMSKDLAEAEEELERMKLEFEKEVENLRIEKLHLEKELSDLKVLNIDGLQGRIETVSDKFEILSPPPVQEDDHIETVENSPQQIQDVPESIENSPQQITAESIENSPLQEQQDTPESIENSPLQEQEYSLHLPQEITSESIENSPHQELVAAQPVEKSPVVKVVKNNLFQNFMRDVPASYASIKVAPTVPAPPAAVVKKEVEKKEVARLPIAAEPPRSSISLFASKYRDENEPKNTAKVDTTKKSVADEFSERMQRDQRFKKIRENCLKNTNSDLQRQTSPKRNVSRSPLSPVREDINSPLKNKKMIWDKAVEKEKPGKREIREKDKENSPQRDTYQEKDANWEQTLRGSERTRTALITAPVRDRIAYWEKENSAKDTDREFSWEKTLRGNTPVVQAKPPANPPRFVISPVRAVSPLTRLGKVVDTTLSQITEPFEQPAVPPKATLTLPPRPPNVNSSPTPGLPTRIAPTKVDASLVPEGVASPPTRQAPVQAAPKAPVNPITIISSPTPGPITRAPKINSPTPGLPSRIASTRIENPFIPEGVASSPVRAPSVRLNIPLLDLNSNNASPQPTPSRTPSVHIASARMKAPSRPTSAVSSPAPGPGLPRVPSTRVHAPPTPEGVSPPPIRAPSARLNVPHLGMNSTSPQPASSRAPSARMQVPKYSLGTDSSTGRIMSNRLNHPVHPPIVIHEDQGAPKPAEGDGSITPRTRAKCVSARNVISTRMNFKTPYEAPIGTNPNAGDCYVERLRTRNFR